MDRVGTWERNLCQESVDRILVWKVGLYWETVPPRGGLRADCRLAMMEMRVTLAKLIWQYDVTLKTVGQEEPTFNHRAVAAGQLEVRLSKVEREELGN